MIRVLIVEDEILAAKRVQRLLGELEEEYEVLAILDSVKNAAKWLVANDHPDLLLLDIQLGDGLSFEIFEIVKVKCPVIFITAFDKYAMDAFNHNGIGYLLKPVNKDALEDALKRFKAMRSMFSDEQQSRNIQQAGTTITGGYKNRFVIKVGDHIRTVLTKEISYIKSKDKATYIHTLEDKIYLVDYSLEQILELLDPEYFFRISRKYIVAIDAIRDIIAYSNSRLELKLAAQDDEAIIVSREKVSLFKAWLDR